MHQFLWKISGICRCVALFIWKKKKKPRWIDEVLFLMLLQNPALTGDLETELNVWHEPIQSTPPKPSSSLYEIVTVEADCAFAWQRLCSPWVLASGLADP